MNRKIFLKGKFLKTKTTIIESTDESLIFTELSNISTIKFDEYIEEIDQSYFSLEDWKQFTNLACWNCCRKFNTRPWFLPLSWTAKVEVGNEIKYKLIHNFPDSINKIEKKLVKPYGNFCHQRCVVRFLDETSDIPASQKPIYLTLLYLLVYEFTGKRVNYIEPAPPRTKMMKYCGGNGWSPERYKQELEKNDAI